MKEATPLETVRLDRWLSAARFYKTRTQAAKACEGRKVKVNGVTAKPHKFLHVGDHITIHHRGRYRDIDVLGLAQRGLPAVEARKLYHEEEKMTMSEKDKELFIMMKKAEKKQPPVKYKGRPTKKKRRQLDKARDDAIPL